MPNSLHSSMPSRETNELTRHGWRELGFFYERDDNTKEWKLIGSRSGLRRFRDALLEYAADPNNDFQSEHEHFGPYMYLEVMTWPTAGMDKHSIHGPLLDLKRLGETIEKNIANSNPGDVVRLRDEFAPNSPYSLILEVRNDDFDPA